MLRHVPDLDSLQLLLTIADSGSLGRAAAAHGISQPAVSARVRTIEALVGFPVLIRSARGSTLTPAGALLVDWARTILHAAQALDAGIDTLRADRAGRLRVAASQTIAEHLLPGWLVRLAADHPDTAVSLTAGNSAQVAADVLAGHADLGFIEGPDLPAGLASRLVARDHLVVVVPRGHPWARRSTPIDAAELAATRLVHREAASGTRAALELALARHAPLAPPLLELSTSSAVRTAVAAGAGPAVLSDLAVRDDITAGTLVHITTSGADLTRRLRAVWPRSQRPTGTAADLLTLIAARTRAALPPPANSSVRFEGTRL